MALELKSRRWWLGVAAAYAGSFGLLGIFATQRWLPGVWACIALLVATSVLFNLILLAHRRDEETKGQHWRRIMIPAIMVAVGLALFLFWILGGKADGFGFIGACLGFLGFGHLLAELRWSKRGRRIVGPIFLVLPAATIIVGLVTMSNVAVRWPATVVIAGILVSPIGLTLISGAVLHRADPNPRWPSIAGMAGGAVLITIGIWLLVLVGQLDLLPAAIVGATLTLLVAAITSNTPADVLIVIAAVALVWSIAPHSVEPAESAVPADGESVMVALGDSFMSGEGAALFYDGTNRKDFNECRRAPTAYAPVVVARPSDAVPDDLAFLACSGAKAKHIIGSAQHPGEPIGGPVTTSPDGTEQRGLSQLGHLAWLRQDKNIDVDLVIVGIGGNDALFGEIGRACVAPGDCTEIAARWLTNLENVKTNIDQAYQEIRDAVGDEVAVIVVPYPVPISPSACRDSLLTANEHRFLYGFTLELNRVAARAAQDAGLYYLEEMATALEKRGLRICDGSAGDVGVNFFGLNAVDGVIETSVNPKNWFHNSLHPNMRGHKAMADTLHDWLAAHPNLPPRPEPAYEVGPPDIATIESIMQDPNFRHCGIPAPGSRTATKLPAPGCTRKPYASAGGRSCLSSSW